jgi:hypothetical protein
VILAAVRSLFDVRRCGLVGWRPRPEQVPLIAQHRRVRDRLTPSATITARSTATRPGVTLPQPGQRLTEPATHPGHLGHAGQQPGAGMTNHTSAVSRDSELLTNPGNLHLADAFRDRRSGPSTGQIIPDQKALLLSRPHPPRRAGQLTPR